jgi:hypothetical protein
MHVWGPRDNSGIYAEVDGRIIFFKPITVKLKNIEDGIPHADLEGAISVRDEQDGIQLSLYSDTNGDGKYDADDRGLANKYSETSGKFHRRPSYTPGGIQKARMVEEATASAYYTEIGKSYSGDTHADWVVCKYLQTGNHWFRVDHTTGHFVFGAVPGDTAPSRITLATGDVEVVDPSRGVILRSPSGSRWRVKVDDSGNLSTSPA